MLESKQKNSNASRVTRGERELLKRIRAAGGAASAWQLEQEAVDSVKKESIHVLISRLVKKGILTGEGKRWQKGRSRKLYIETSLGKEIDL